MFKKCAVHFSWFVLLFLMSSSVFATRARMDGMNNSPFFYDDTDVFRYPSQLLLQSNKLLVEAMPTRQTGSGGLLWSGEKMGIGVFFNRPSTFNDLGATATLLGAQLTPPSRLFDLVGAFRVGYYDTVGIGLSFSNFLASEMNASGTSRDNRVDGNQSWSLELTVGYTMKRSNLKLDIGAEFAFNMYKNVISDEIVNNGSLIPSFSTFGRGFFQMTKTVDLAFEVVIANRHYSLNVPSHVSSVSYNRFWMEALIGPFVSIIRKKNNPGKKASSVLEKLPIDAYFTGGILLGFERIGGANSLGPELLKDANLNQASNAFLVPGFHAALEATIGQYVTLRMGLTARYYFLASSTSVQGNTEPVDTEKPSNKSDVSKSQTQQVYNWSAGISLHLHGFTLDGSFSAPLFTQGPNFIGGGSPGLFGQAALSYKW